MRKHRIKASCCRFVDALEQMAVDVKHGPHRGVAEAGGDGLGVLTSLDEQGGVGVAQVVEATRFANRRSYGREPVPTSEVGSA